MTKPIAKNASPVFHIRGHQLRSVTVSKLLTLLGFPDYDLQQEALNHQLPGYRVENSETGDPLILNRQTENTEGLAKNDLGSVIRRVELALGLYVEGYKHLDQIPRAADYLNTFQSLRVDALGLLVRLVGLGGYYRDQFEIKGENIHSIEQSLASLVGVCEAVQNDMKGQKSKGAPVNRALIVTIKELLKIFRASAVLLTKGNEIEFVKLALVDAKILKPLPANKDKPSDQQEIDFTKKVARYISQADKSIVPMPKRF
jgi:hypothetical protein